jgi:hypothetical protein
VKKLILLITASVFIVSCGTDETEFSEATKIETQEEAKKANDQAIDFENKVKDLDIMEIFIDFEIDMPEIKKESLRDKIFDLKQDLFDGYTDTDQDYEFIRAEFLLAGSKSRSCKMYRETTELKKFYMIVIKMPCKTRTYLVDRSYLPK